VHGWRSHRLESTIAYGRIDYIFEQAKYHYHLRVNFPCRSARHPPVCGRLRVSLQRILERAAIRSGQMSDAVNVEFVVISSLFEYGVCLHFILEFEWQSKE
jgi:hypothetical protein